MPESTKPPVLESRNSNLDSNLEGEQTPKKTREQAPTTPPAIQEAVVETVVRIVGTTSSNLSDESATYDNPLLQRKEPLSHSLSDGHIYNGSKARVEAPKNIRYQRSISGFTDFIGNKAVADINKLNKLPEKEAERYQQWMTQGPKELESLLRKPLDYKNSVSEISGNSTVDNFIESRDGSGTSDPAEPDENDPDGFDLAGYQDQINSRDFSIPSSEKEEHHSD